MLSTTDIEEERLIGAHTAGALLRATLEAFAARHPTVGDARGTGLLIGVELISDKGARDSAPHLAHAVMNDMKERGILVGLTGPNNNVLKIRPPLVLNNDDAATITETLDPALTTRSP